MRGSAGYALVLVIMATLLCFLLGAALLEIGLADLRVSRHLSEAMQAKYFAEAGVETLVGGLPRRPSDLIGYSTVIERDDDLCFTVTAQPLSGEAYGIEVISEGRAGGKRRQVQARVRYLPLGSYGVIAQSLHAEALDVRGGVLCGLLWVGPGVTRIGGNLHAGEVPLSLGTVTSGGYSCENHEVKDSYFALTDWLAAAAGWPVPPFVDGAYRLADGESGRWYVPGELVLEGSGPDGALLAVAGNVRVEELPAGRVVLLAAGDVTFLREEPAELLDGQQLVVIASGWIRGKGLALRGVLAAPEVDLSGMVISYCDRAVLEWLDELPESLFTGCGSFLVEWVETEVRR